MLDPSHHSSRLRCPQCGQGLQRVPRRNADVALPANTGMRRYRCRSEVCDWQGLRLPPPQPAAIGRGRRLPSWLPAAWAGLKGLVAAAAVPALLVLAMGLGNAMDRSAQAAVPAGESHDGGPLRPGLSLDTAAADAHESALTLRQGCAWGKPGRNPYLGSTAQALTQARLPPEVVQEIVRKRQAHEVSGRLKISRNGIRTADGQREFNPRSFTMSFGRSLCLNSRVNFAPGHVELADLYEARDARGRRYAVMVPDVCGNVSVLGARGQRNGSRGLASGGPMLQTLAEALDGGGDLDFLGTLQIGGVQASVPEPGTLGCVLAALAAMVWARRRRPAAPPR